MAGSAAGSFLLLRANISYRQCCLKAVHLPALRLLTRGSPPLSPAGFCRRPDVVLVAHLHPAPRPVLPAEALLQHLAARPPHPAAAHPPGSAAAAPGRAPPARAQPPGPHLSPPPRQPPFCSQGRPPRPFLPWVSSCISSWFEPQGRDLSDGLGSLCPARWGPVVTRRRPCCPHELRPCHQWGPSQRAGLCLGSQNPLVSCFGVREDSP